MTNPINLITLRSFYNEARRLGISLKSISLAPDQWDSIAAIFSEDCRKQGWFELNGIPVVRADASP